jgi:hypothetical protein
MLLLKKKETYLASGVIVLVYLLHPSMINTLVSIMSCRDIGGVKYVLADLTYNCYDD